MSKGFVVRKAYIILDGWVFLHGLSQMNELFRGHGPWIIPNEWLSFSSEKITSSWLVDLTKWMRIPIAGYLYFHKAPNKEEFHEENCRKASENAAGPGWNFNVLIIEKTV